MLKSCLLPFHQDANHVQLLSMHLFRDVMEFVVGEGKKPLKQHVHRSLIPLLCHLYDENQRVAEVRISDLPVSPWQVAQLPPALAPRGLQRSSLPLSLTTEQQLWGTSVPLPWQHQVPEMGLEPLLCPGAKPVDGRVPQLLHLPTRGQDRPRALPRCRGHRSCVLGSGAISQSLLLCRPLRKPCFKLPSS